MLKFDPDNRVKKVENDIYCVSIGTQSNCAGIACVLASISKAPNEESGNLGVDSLGNLSNNEKFFGRDIPEPFQAAVLSGVEEQLIQMKQKDSIKFRLIGILYHPVDSNINMHKIAGKALVKNWVQENA